MRARRRTRAWALAALASLLVLGAAAPGVRAQTEATTLEPAVQTLDDPVEDRVIGVVGAMICGAEGYLLRTNPTLGLNPYVAGIGLLGCFAALVDVLTT